MAGTTDPAIDDPAIDDRANYDHVSETPAAQEAASDLAADLRPVLDGEVRVDRYTRRMYATDASVYSILPVGVVYPASTGDVSEVVAYCADRGVPVLPRGGGTSLAGQAVNEAVVLDFSRYMNDVVAIDPEAATARAEAGVTIGDLDRALEPHGLKFAPDPSTAEQAVLGGSIGNNTTGAHSLKYGKTDAYVEEIEAVLADGTVATFGEITVEALREAADPDGDLLARIYAEIVDLIDHEADRIETTFPDLKRNVSGYNLDVLIEEAETGTVNLARLLVGSEGTLAVVTEATVSLEPIPETKAVAVLTYRTLLDAMEDVGAILEHDPAAVEVMDDVLLDLARETEEFAPVVGELPDGTDSFLLVEFYADSDAEGRRKVAELIDDRVGDVAFDVLEAHDPDERDRLWKMRKASSPILLSRTGSEKHIAFIEDVAVPTENLVEYVADFQDVLADNDTFGSFYAHAGPGCLHVRPLIDTGTVAGIETMASVADGVTDVAVKYGGSVSGEHGDGRARTQWNRKLYGDEMIAVFRDLKTAFDPDWLLNPGPVCGEVDMTEDLRFDLDGAFDAGFDPTLEWDNEKGFQGMVELCHGCGGCRTTQEGGGGVMCPTYRAAQEEITSTRGRANLLRSAMYGDLSDEEIYSEAFVTEVLDLCVGCKGCKIDCPSGVDMAKLKAEVTHAVHQREGKTVRDRLFANFSRVARLGSATAPLSNWLQELPGARLVAERVFGIARDRELPTFDRRTFQDRAAGRQSPVLDSETDRRALLLPDLYTNHLHPEAGTAALDVLAAAGVPVEVPPVTDTGRPAFSKGFLDRSRTIAESVVEELVPRVENGWDVVAIEPSDAVMLQSDYRDLLSGADVEALAENTYGVCEYLDRFDLDADLPVSAPDERLAYHGHCHQKAAGKDHHAVDVLRRAGFAVDVLDSTCCGMAGSFGYEAEHYSMSQAIGTVLFEQIEETDPDYVVAPGASCRTQIEDEFGRELPHPIEKVAEALEESEALP